MATYCMSDIHGEYEAYKALLERIGFSDRDTLYVLGDAIDRGPRSMDVLMDMMMRPNVIPLIGNHEYMALSCLRFLAAEITEESLEKVDDDAIRGLMEWQTVGGSETIGSFGRLSAEDKADVLEYLEEFSLYEEVSCGGEDYVLVHAGLLNFSPKRPLSDYSLPEMVFRVPDYSRVYFPDKYLVTGHLPTAAIKDNPAPNRVYRANRHIAIDCGCTFGGSLAAVCLETGEEFYI
ncbi:MAG: metallophosphoesterase [Clostridiales bacterium]|nr:metallophosphoesterase [Clostridiales bacterium]